MIKEKITKPLHTYIIKCLLCALNDKRTDHVCYILDALAHWYGESPKYQNISLLSKVTTKKLSPLKILNASFCITDGLTNKKL